MRRRSTWFVVIAGLAGCDPAGRSDAPAMDAAGDAEPDADVIDEHAVPISVSGSSPLGPLDGFGFAEAFYGCGNKLAIQLKTTPKVDHEPYIEIELRNPTSMATSGPLPATVAGYRWDATNGWNSVGFTAATFDAVVLDPQFAMQGRVTGTVTSSDPGAGWALAFSVDLTFYLNIGSCTL